MIEHDSGVLVVEPGYTIETPRAFTREYPRLIEQAGRTCYKSEAKITPDSADQFVRGLIKRGHESVLEHLSITVKIVCDRSTSHQLVRHRLAAYSQESQRYCDYGKKRLQVICPPTIRDKGFRDWMGHCCRSYQVYLDLRDAGIPPEDARSVLPNATKTEVVTTFDLRQWRHVFVERALNTKAQWQIRLIFRSVLDEFSFLLPCVFDDLKQMESW